MIDVNGMITLETKAKEVIQRTYNIKSIRFELKEDVQFKPGQYFLVTIRVDGAEQTKALSISNSPTETGYLECTKKLTGSLYSSALDKMKPGSWVRLKLPMGNFTFEGEYPKIAFLSGGIGITPIRSMCRYATDKKLTTDIILVYSNNKKEDIAFMDDFREMQEVNKNLKVVYTLTNPDENKEGKRYREGRITSDMIKEETPDYSERVFFICGPPKMVEGMECLLRDVLKVNESQIKREHFAGY